MYLLRNCVVLVLVGVHVCTHVAFCTHRYIYCILAGKDVCIKYIFIVC